MKRRTFIKTSTLAGASATILSSYSLKAKEVIHSHMKGSKGPIVLSTWDFTIPVNQTVDRALGEGGSLLDAVEKGIRIVEEDPKITSVGRGGYPDRDGHLTLDACIMDENGNAGSVVFLEHIMHPISVARLVMRSIEARSAHCKSSKNSTRLLIQSPSDHIGLG